MVVLKLEVHGLKAFLRHVYSHIIMFTFYLLILIKGCLSSCSTRSVHRASVLLCSHFLVKPVKDSCGCFFLKKNITFNQAVTQYCSSILIHYFKEPQKNKQKKPPTNTNHQLTITVSRCVLGTKWLLSKTEAVGDTSRSTRNSNDNKNVNESFHIGSCPST